MSKHSLCRLFYCDDFDSSLAQGKKNFKNKLNEIQKWPPQTEASEHYQLLINSYTLQSLLLQATGADSVGLTIQSEVWIAMNSLEIILCNIKFKTRMYIRSISQNILPYSLK